MKGPAPPLLALRYTCFLKAFCIDYMCYYVNTVTLKFSLMKRLEKIRKLPGARAIGLQEQKQIGYKGGCYGGCYLFGWYGCDDTSATYGEMTACLAEVDKGCSTYCQ